MTAPRIVGTNGHARTGRAAALHFLRCGVFPVPVTPGTKGCHLKDWDKLRLTEAEVDRVFSPNSGVGLLLGEPSGGLVDVDLDCPEAIDTAPFFLPPTELIGGRESAPASHYWFVVDDPPPKASTVFRDPVTGEKLLELRSTGGMTVVAPTLYPADVKKGHPKPERCVWSKYGEPGHVTATGLRASLNPVAAAALLARYWPKVGGRHDAALALSGGLLRAGRPVDWVEKFVEAVATTARDEQVNDRVRCVAATDEKLRDKKHSTGWPKLEEHLGEHGPKVVSAVMGWLNVAIGNDGRARIGGGRVSEVSGVVQDRYGPVPAYTPFPTDVFPAPWDAFVREGAAALKCDEALVALPLMAVLAGAIGNTRRVHLGAEWFEPAILWTCPVAESGGMKTSAANLSIDLVRARQKRLVRTFKNDLGEYKRKMMEYKKAVAEGKDAEQPDKPTLARVVVSDTTIEKLASLHDENRRGLLAARDELAGWFGSFTRYKGKAGGTDEPNWLSMHRGDAVIVDRKTGDKPSLFVPHAATSITGGIQPGILRKLAGQDLFASGMVARIIFAMPPRTPKQWSDDEIGAGTKEAAQKSLDALYEIAGGTDEDGDLVPVVVKLGGEAKARLKHFVNQWGIRSFEVEGDRAAALAKLEALPGRWALIRHTILKAGTLEDTDPIGLDCLEAGIRLAEWCAGEAERVYGVINESAVERDVRHLVELVGRLAERNGGRVSVRTIQRANSRKYRVPELAKDDLDKLVGLGLGRWEAAPERAGGGWKPTYFILSPTPCTTHDTSDTRPDDRDEDEDTGGHDTRPDGPEGPTTPPAGSPDSTHSLVGDCADDTESGRGQVSEVSCVVQGIQPGEHGVPDVDGTGGGCRAATGASVMRAEHVGTSARLIDKAADLPVVIRGVCHSRRVGLDTETTGLRHDAHRVRLLSLATAEGTFLLDLEKIRPGTTPEWGTLMQVLADTTVVGHNLGFDLPFLMHKGFSPGSVFDTMLASQVLHAGDRTVRHTLRDVAQRALGREIDKGLQKADWSGRLTPAMLRYAADDAELPLELASRLEVLIRDAGLAKTVEVENAALPAVAWAAFKGVGFDRKAWAALATAAGLEQQRLVEELDRLAPNSGTLTGTRNWNSPEQVAGAFAALGITLESTDDDALAALDHPLAEALRAYRSAAKLAGTYGDGWLKHDRNCGRVFATWKQIGAGASGRMSCKEPNLQQLPRDPRYRKCFTAPPGRVLVKADYSQIELRIAAKITGDKRMLAAYRDGEDLHTLTARALLGKEDVTRADRQLAKAINFGLLYGMGAKNLMVYARSNYGVTITEDEAKAHRETFFKTYTGLRKWHQSVKDGATDTRTLGKRRRLGVTAFTEKLNTPVQGTGADGMKKALAILWARQEECPDAFPVLLVHDEIVVECDEQRQEQTAVWLRAAMRDGMAPLIDPVPVEVEVDARMTWGG